MVHGGRELVAPQLQQRMAQHANEANDVRDESYADNQGDSSFNYLFSLTKHDLFYGGAQYHHHHHFFLEGQSLSNFASGFIYQTDIIISFLGRIVLSCEHPWILNLNDMKA